MEFKLQSDEIGELVKAMIAAEAEYSNIIADDGGNWGSFASLDAIRDVTKPALAKYGLRYDQGPSWHEGNVFIVSSLNHISGQWKRWYMPISIADNARDHNQAWGASQSYQRRYSSYGILGLGKGDDNDPESTKEGREKAPVQQQPASNAISEKQLGLLKVKLGGNAEREAKLCAHYKIATLAQLPWKHMSEAINILDGKVS